MKRLVTNDVMSIHPVSCRSRYGPSTNHWMEKHITTTQRPNNPPGRNQMNSNHLQR